MEKKNDFLEINQEAMPVLGFWTETFKSVVIAGIESTYKKEVTDEWSIADVVFNGDTVLIKWKKNLNFK